MDLWNFIELCSKKFYFFIIQGQYNKNFLNLKFRQLKLLVFLFSKSFNFDAVANEVLFQYQTIMVLRTMERVTYKILQCLRDLIERKPKDTVVLLYKSTILIDGNTLCKIFVLLIRNI